MKISYTILAVWVLFELVYILTDEHKETKFVRYVKTFVMSARAGFFVGVLLFLLAKIFSE